VVAMPLAGEEVLQAIGMEPDGAVDEAVLVGASSRASSSSKTRRLSGLGTRRGSRFWGFVRATKPEGQGSDGVPSSCGSGHRDVRWRRVPGRRRLRLQPLEDPLRRMPLLLRGLLVGFEDFMKIDNTAAKTRRGRAWLCRYPGSSACARIFLRVCQPTLYFKQAARWLRPRTSKSWRIALQISMSLRTS
jgi:hypothetical protein